MHPKYRSNVINSFGAVSLNTFPHMLAVCKLLTSQYVIISQSRHNIFLYSMMFFTVTGK